MSCGRSRPARRSCVGAAGILEFGDAEPVRKALAILAERFASIDAIGPASVALYRRAALGSPEADQLRALGYARVARLLGRIRGDA